MTDTLCVCGREGLDSMFHPESCPAYQGSRPAVYDGWWRPAERSEFPVHCIQCGKAWDIADVLVGRCGGCGGFECAAPG